ncbi:hypothetical protein RhiirA1_405178, partial [Rhizophagus irregularis]
MEQPNVLLLDEPTNDLDIETLGVLEDFIEHFPGVVLTISHDRFFLDRIAKKLWILDGKGNVDESLEVYSDYLEKQNLLDKVEIKEEKVEKPKQQKVKNDKKKLSFKEQKEWETISDSISQVENDIMITEEEITNAGSDYTKLQQLTEKLDQLNKEYERLIERWSYLEEIVVIDEELPFGKSYNYTKENVADAPSEVQAILKVEGVKGVYHVADFLAVERNAKYNWETILSSIRNALGEKSDKVEQSEQAVEHYGEVFVHVQMFRGIPLQIKVFDSSSEHRISTGERFAQAFQSVEIDKMDDNYLLERKWVDFG